MWECILAAAAAAAGGSVSASAVPDSRPPGVVEHLPRWYGFEANHGQESPQVRFASRGPGYRLFLTDREAVFVWRTPGQRRAAMLRMQFGGRPAAVAGAQQLPARFNFIRGNAPAAWRTSVPAFARVTYRRVYPGIDVTFHHEHGSLEYDIELAPGAKAESVRIRFVGADEVARDGEGRLRVRLAGHEVVFGAPRIYQPGGAGSARRAVGGSYVVRPNGDVRFEVSDVDRRQALVIDPILEYSTFLGGSGFDEGRVVTDAAGNAYVGGQTYSADFPATAGAYDTNCGTGGFCDGDAFVAKFDPNGALLYATFVGGNGEEYSPGIAVDDAGNAYIVGWTYSANFPVTAGAFQTTFRPGFALGTDAFVTKIDPSGAGLVYSTYLGGSQTPGYGDGDDLASAIAVDGSGRAHVTGYTSSKNFPLTASAYQTQNRGVQDAFLTVLNGAGSALEYSTLLGGTDFDAPNAIALDDAGVVYVTGVTLSTDLPVTPGVVQTTDGGRGRVDAFVAKIDPAASGGASLAYLTYLGGDNDDRGRGIAVDAAGNVHIAGLTNSANFPVINAFQGTCRGCHNISLVDGFLAKLNPTATSLLYSTFFGGSMGEGLESISIDAHGRTYVAGTTNSMDLPVKFAEQPQHGGGTSDAVIAAFDTTVAGEASLLYSSYLGGGGGSPSRYGNDGAHSISIHGDHFWVAGHTTSSDFPIRDAFDNTYGGVDVFVSRFSALPADFIFADGFEAR
jgi:hypothetical protein